MIQCQYDPPSGQQRIFTPAANRLLRQHPVLIPVALLCGSIGMCIVSLFADTLFPVLAVIGAPSTLMCLLGALVMGIAGILATIISIIENIDRTRLRTELFPRSKEGA